MARRQARRVSRSGPALGDVAIEIANLRAEPLLLLDARVDGSRSNAMKSARAARSVGRQRIQERQALFEQPQNSVRSPIVPV